MKTRIILYGLPLLILLSAGQKQEWISLFDGQTLDGWRASENKDSWIVKDGAIVTNGPRSHLFYEGDVMNHDFRNFEFMAEVKTKVAIGGSISGSFKVTVRVKTVR